MFDVCGPRGCGDTPPPLQMPAGLMCLFEELHRMHSNREGKSMAVQWAGLSCGHFGWSPMLN